MEIKPTAIGPGAVEVTITLQMSSRLLQRIQLFLTLREIASFEELILSLLDRNIPDLPQGEQAEQPFLDCRSRQLELSRVVKILYRLGQCAATQEELDWYKDAIASLGEVFSVLEQ